ncbi:hypothetical protein BOTBODRAFT_82144, partial [Botryobasidium botryosum FD-172 SS1]
KTTFEKMREEQQAKKEMPWAPFASLEEWALAEWLIKSEVSQAKVDDFLQLKSTKSCGLSFKNKRAFYKVVDRLPVGPGWSCHELNIEGDVIDPSTNEPMVENLELWWRDPVECVAELIGNAMFNQFMKYAPFK